MSTQDDTGQDLIEYFQEQGYTPWYNAIDFEVAAGSKCEHCHHVGLEFTGFQGFGERHAVAKCPKCGEQFEF